MSPTRHKTTFPAKWLDEVLCLAWLLKTPRNLLLPTWDILTLVHSGCIFVEVPRSLSAWFCSSLSCTLVLFTRYRVLSSLLKCYLHFLCVVFIHFPSMFGSLLLVDVYLRQNSVHRFLSVRVGSSKGSLNLELTPFCFTVNAICSRYLPFAVDMSDRKIAPKCTLHLLMLVSADLDSQ